jgi:SPP1 gp7 family putative phage head morphogenesis protein
MMAEERLSKDAGQYKNLNNEEYWTKRTEENVDKQWKSIKNVEKELAKQYRIAMDDIRQMVIDLFTQHATETGLTYQDAMKQLNAMEIGDYKAKLERLRPLIQKTNDPFLISEYEKLQKVVKLNRLQAVMGQIDARLLQLGHSQQVTMEEHLAGTYESNYYQTMYMVQAGLGMGVAFALLDEDAITEAITLPWSGDQFSDRIWTNKARLVTTIRQTLIQGLIKGESVQTMARNLKNDMNSSYSNALRLVRTETAYVIGESTAKAYEESKVVHQYIYLATLDGRTSHVCSKLDNKVINLKDRQVGINASPMHPNCRSTEVPYFNGDDLEGSLRSARGDDGEIYYVPANMNYQEWHKQYVENGKPN